MLRFDLNGDDGDSGRPTASSGFSVGASFGFRSRQFAFGHRWDRQALGRGVRDLPSGAQHRIELLLSLSIAENRAHLRRKLQPDGPRW